MVCINCVGDQLPPKGNPINKIIYLFNAQTLAGIDIFIDLKKLLDEFTCTKVNKVIILESQNHLT